MDTQKRDQFVSKILDKMSISEKVGQCFSFCWRGSIITPAIVDTIEKLHVGGLRIEPYTTESSKALYYGKSGLDERFVPPSDYFTISQTYFKIKEPSIVIDPDEYAERLNTLKDIAMNRPSGIPLHVCLDYEGGFNHNFDYGKMSFFPSQMGITAAQDPSLPYRVGYALGQQLKAIGVTMVHSPVCDVNTNPDNPEINIRSFGPDPDICTKYALDMARGIQDAGVVATAKHFPGRGEGSADAHHALEVIRLSKERMHSVELKPYKALIEMGVGAIMTAHSSFPAFDSEDTPATLSYKILTELLRNELGFKGVITTDAMGMGAIVKNWGIPRACVMAVKAGANLLLVKNDNELKSQCFFELKRAVETGELSEEKLTESVRYVLNMKYDQGLFENGGKVDPKQAPIIINSDEIKSVNREAAEKALTLIRDREGLLPLRKEQKVMVIEQLVPAEFIPNTTNCHPHSFIEYMLKHSMNMIIADCEFSATEEDEKFLIEKSADADVVVVTNFYYRILKDNNYNFVKKLIAAGRKVVVLTNTPYEVGAPEEAGTVVCSYNPCGESLRVSADFLFGKATAPGKLVK
ncbi:MAG: putative lipoprotein YbbD precursor [Firmicutes bacterium ADurb.Bin193]|nr:MAG: putative lipoprotein YbbD precursor [Firmicutes bacterium ADurb.Bin193]